MVTEEGEEDLLRSVVTQNAKSVRIARRRLERELIEANEALARKTEELAGSEARYRSALRTGGMGNWETDLAASTRTWSEEGMAIFGLTLVDGRGCVGGQADEFRMALHPDDRHLVEEFHALADRQDSFPAEYRIVRPDGTIRWLSGRGQVVARGRDGKAQRLVSVVADITERKIAEEHVQFLMRELTHRSKNLLAVVQGIAGQTMRTTGTMDEFREKFMQRLQGLAASHELLVDRNWQGASLADLVRDQLSPFAEVGGRRLNVSGPDVLVSPETAEAIGLALHELATNAVKYGALSVLVGQVTVFWALEKHGTEKHGTEKHGTEPRRLRLSWVEQNGPLVVAPTRKGFGRLVFEEITAKRLNGEIVTDFAPTGLNWQLSISTAHLVTEPDEDLESLAPRE
jgi:PAS domain S-box-containing protein